MQSLDPSPVKTTIYGDKICIFGEICEPVCYHIIKPVDKLISAIMKK